MKKALFAKGNKCSLCPHNCTINTDKRGLCGVRMNVNGKINSLVYGYPVSLNIDPIEKKPLYHFFPGAKIFSLGTFGCNFFCGWCQNYEIARKKPEIKEEIDYYSPNDIISLCEKNKCEMIAYTYNEPTIYYEYMLDIAKEAKRNNIKNVIVSNGYINEKPLKKLCKYIDAANIDLKFFNEANHLKYTGGRLENVLETLKTLKKEGVWVEITNLLIPGLNDDMRDFENMCKWISENLGKETPLHISRFFPNYKMQDINPTDMDILLKSKKIGDKYLSYVYLGNINNESDTFCPKCRSLAVKRKNHKIQDFTINGDCSSCKEKILIST